MCKKLISLISVLVIAGISSAGSVIWNEHVQTGNWEDVSNWVTTTGTANGALPGTGDFAGAYPRANGGTGTSYTNVTINLSSSQSVGRVKPQLNTMTLNINNGGTLLNNGSVGSMQMYGGTAETVNIANGGALIARGSATGLQTGSGSHTININSGGLLGVYGSAGYLSTNALWLGGTSSGAGSTTINVYAGAVLDVDSVTLANSNHVIKLYAGSVMYVRGIVTNPQYLIYGEYGVPVQLSMTGVIDPVSGNNSGQTVTMFEGAPEPATLLLLSLGAVMLRKR